MSFSSTGRTLVVGDGDFSFSRGLATHLGTGAVGAPKVQHRQG